MTLGASGGAPPYSWSIDGGTFPPGLALGADGSVTGKDTQAGQFKFDVKVTDSTGGTATSPSGFGVFTAMTVSQPCASQCIVGAGCAKCGGFGTVSGGLAPYTYKIVGGYVPDGMTLNGLSLKGGFPQTPLGAFNLSVQVTDVFTASATVNATWFVYNPAILNPGSDCTDPNFTGTCAATGWTYNGGGGPSDPSVRIIGVRPYCPDGCFYPDPQGKLPPLWTATAKGGVLTMHAGLNPTCTTYAAILTIELVDVSPCATTIPSNTQDIIVVVGSNPNC